MLSSCDVSLGFVATKDGFVAYATRKSDAQPVDGVEITMYGHSWQVRWLLTTSILFIVGRPVLPLHVSRLLAALLDHVFYWLVAVHLEAACLLHIQAPCTEQRALYCISRVSWIASRPRACGS